MHKQHVFGALQTAIAIPYASLGVCTGILLFHSTENSRRLHENQLTLPSCFIKAKLQQISSLQDLVMQLGSPFHINGRRNQGILIRPSECAERHHRSFYKQQKFPDIQNSSPTRFSKSFVLDEKGLTALSGAKNSNCLNRPVTPFMQPRPWTQKGLSHPKPLLPPRLLCSCLLT